MSHAKYVVTLGIFAIIVLAFTVQAKDRYPVRIVSLGPTVTEKLYILGEGERIAGVTTYCVRPPQAQKKEKVGSVTQVSVEKVLQLTPDLVIATSLTDPKAISKLRSLGIRTMLVKEPDSFAEMNAQFISIAKAVGKEEKAIEIVREAEKKVESIRKRNFGTKRPKVFIQVGTKPLFTATKGSFINDFIEYAGGVNIAGDAFNGSYSRERVVKEDPDVILIVSMGLAAEDEKKAWQKFSSLSAVKTGRLHILDPYKVCSPTPVTFAETLENVAVALHPDDHPVEGKR